MFLSVYKVNMQNVTRWTKLQQLTKVSFIIFNHNTNTKRKAYRYSQIAECVSRKRVRELL